jgi:hypothetical protein
MATTHHHQMKNAHWHVAMAISNTSMSANNAMKFVRNVMGLTHKIVLNAQWRNPYN